MAPVRPARCPRRDARYLGTCPIAVVAPCPRGVHPLTCQSLAVTGVSSFPVFIGTAMIVAGGAILARRRHSIDTSAGRATTTPTLPRPAPPSKAVPAAAAESREAGARAPNAAADAPTTGPGPAGIEVRRRLARSTDDDHHEHERGPEGSSTPSARIRSASTDGLWIVRWAPIADLLRCLVPSG